MKKKILIGFGTRPEVIKLAPVIHALNTTCKVELLHTGQHKELTEPLFELFDLTPDHRLGIMKAGQDLFYLTHALLPGLKQILLTSSPDYVMVQGDTTTSYITALAAFYMQIPVLHVEAGLRSHHLYNPFPEEMNRKQISQLAHFHFAPTERNKKNLLAEGVPEESISVTGNTVIDALQYIKNSVRFNESAPAILSELSAKDFIIVLTAHRMENHGEPLLNILSAVNRLLEGNEHVKVLFPAHPNPMVKKALNEANIQNNRFIQTNPYTYLDFLHILKRADLILTDSGGIQEEATALAKPVLVLRNETERQELIESGYSKLVGSEADTIVTESLKVINTPQTKDPVNLFGDGKAALKIRQVIQDQL